MYVCTYVRTYVRTYICMMYVCMHVCMYVGMYVCTVVWKYFVGKIFVGNEIYKKILHEKF